MTQKEFEKIVEELDKLSKNEMLKKRPEYTLSDSDILANFKNTAERLGISELKVFGTFLDKQVSSVFSHISNANLPEAEKIESRFADIINYSYLGLALFRERKGKQKK